MNKNNKIIIVGAGLCGSLLAIRLAQKGFQVVVYERRSDMRKGVEDAGRSINLALSARGLLSLEKAGIKEAILKECIPMRGRMIHPLGGEKFLSKYSGRAEDYINSVSRPGLNLALIKEADRFENVKLKFDTKVIKVDLEEARIEYELDGEFCEDQGAIVIGTDGAGSVVRRSMMGQTTKLLFNYSQDFLRHGYKELSILPAENGSWQLEKEALHIWPNGSFMIIALPNLDGSFTLTMFHPYEGEAGFNTLNTKEKVKAFFEQYYPTLLPYIPHLYEEYFENPVGTLGTTKCYPWQAYGKTLIMGDAAHAIVPFYGQGMNASLEDVRVFNELLEKYGENWETLFKAFQDARKENADAIAALAIDNFYEMRDHVDDVAFMRKRKIEMQLEQQFEDYYSKYSLVTFQPKLSYQEAMKRGRKQDQILLDLCENDNFEQLPLQAFFEKAMS
ncbi:MAG: NAD(P)/FAD-dependent oxidoreductase [Bacteroidota bacterium]